LMGTSAGTQKQASGHATTPQPGQVAPPENTHLRP
jgi:hypothetical protein